LHGVLEAKEVETARGDSDFTRFVVDYATSPRLQGQGGGCVPVPLRESALVSPPLEHSPDKLLQKRHVLAERERQCITQQVLYLLEQAVMLGEDAEGSGLAQRAQAGSDDKQEGH
jgi:hypothetical protein